MPIIPRLVVELYEHNRYRGRKVTIIDSIPDTSEIKANDMISSIKIYSGPGFQSASNYKAVFCEFPKFNAGQKDGRKLVLGPGFYPNIHEIPYNFGDIISSIAFTPSANPTPPEYGAVPVIVEVYYDTNFEGQQGIILRDVSSLEDVGMSNVISSLRIYRGPDFPFAGCQVIFYDNPNFEGARLPIHLGPREYHREITNLHRERFGDIISSVKIAPTGEFNVLIVIGDSRTTEPAILESLTEVAGSEFKYKTVKVNPNANNHGDPYNSEPLSKLDLSAYDIIWLTWNAVGHDKEYFITDSEDKIKDFVKKGGVVWASAMDNNNTPEGKWRGRWVPLERHFMDVVNSGDVNIAITEEGRKTGIFTWPNKVNADALTTDDHFILRGRGYRVLAQRMDNKEPVGTRLRWGEGYYVLFAVDTRDALRASQAKTFVENALCYLASLAWQTSPKQPLRKKRHRTFAERRT